MTGTTNTNDKALDDLRARLATHFTYGTDLDWVVDQLDTIDPIDIESEEPTDTDYEVHRALNYVRAQITRRKAVQAGPRTDVDYCGVDDKYGRACGPDLGLPQCAWHGRGAERDMTAANRPELDNSTAEGGAR